MDKQCLLSQLEGTVKNGSLPWVFGMKVYIDWSYSKTVSGGGIIGVNNPVKVSIGGSSPTNGKVAVSNGSTISFDNRGDVYILVKESNPKMYFQSYGGVFDNAYVQVKINDFIYGASLVNATVIDVYNTKILGDISEFANYRMTKIFIRSTGNQLYGTLENLVEKYFARTDYSEEFVGNSMGVYIPSADVTFHETAISTALTCSFNANSVTISDTSTSALLATYDGSTWTYNS